MADLPDLPSNPYFDITEVEAHVRESVVADLQSASIEELLQQFGDQSNWPHAIPEPDDVFDFLDWPRDLEDDPSGAFPSGIDDEEYHTIGSVPFAAVLQNDQGTDMYQSESNEQLNAFLMDAVRVDEPREAPEPCCDQNESELFASNLLGAFPPPPQEVMSEIPQTSAPDDDFSEYVDLQWLTATSDQYENGSMSGPPQENSEHTPDHDADKSKMNCPKAQACGRSIIPRKLRDRRPIESSDPHERVSANHVFLPRSTRGMGTGHQNAGKNLMAMYGDDEVPRTKWPLLVDRGRKGPFFSDIHPSLDNPIPARTSLEEVCRNYPNHVWGSGLRIFMREDWEAERIWRLLPEGCKCTEAKTRKWNYLQQAMGREADRIWEESGQPRQKRVGPQKRGRTAGSDDGPDDEDTDSAVLEPKRTRTRKPRASNMRLRHSSDSMRDSTEPPSDNADLGSVLPSSVALLGHSTSCDQLAFPSSSSQPSQQHLEQYEVGDNRTWTTLRRLDELCNSAQAFCVKCFQFHMQARDLLFRGLPLPQQAQLANQAFQDFMSRQLNGLVKRFNLAGCIQARTSPVEVFKAIIYAQQTTDANAVGCDRGSMVDIDARRGYAQMLTFWARRLAAQSRRPTTSHSSWSEVSSSKRSVLEIATHAVGQVHNTNAESDSHGGFCDQRLAVPQTQQVNQQFGHQSQDPVLPMLSQGGPGMSDSDRGAQSVDAAQAFLCSHHLRSSAGANIQLGGDVSRSVPLMQAPKPNASRQHRSGLGYLQPGNGRRTLCSGSQTSQMNTARELPLQYSCRRHPGIHKKDAQRQPVTRSTSAASSRLSAQMSLTSVPMAFRQELLEVSHMQQSSVLDLDHMEIEFKEPSL